MPTAFEEKKIRHASGDSSKSCDSVSNYIPTPPDGGYGWVIVMASFLNHVFVDGISFTFGIFYLEFLEQFNAGSSKTALVGSLLVGTYLMTGPIASGLTNKFGCRPVCMVGGIIAALAFFLATFSTSIHFLMLTYGVLAGFGFGLVYLPSVISVSYYFEKRRAMATGIAVCGAGVGCFLFAPLAGYLLKVFNWKHSLMIVSALVLNTVLCGALMRPLKPTRELPKPREKNVLDRLVEQTKAKMGLQRSESIYSTRTAAKVNGEIAEKVHEMKLNREKLVREELGESEPNSALNSCYLSNDNSRLPSRSCSVVDRSLDTGHKIGIANGEIKVPTIVLENGENGEVLECDVTEALIGNPSAHRPPIYKGPRSNSVGMKKELQVMLLQKKLEQVQNGDARTLESAPSLHIHGLHRQTSAPAKPEQFHSDVWTIKKLHQRKCESKIDGHNKADYARPMYRKDIFYSGSVYNVAEFHQSQQDIDTYLKSVTSIPAEVSPQKEAGVWKACSCLPKVFTDVLKQMFDFNILRDKVFIIACLANMVGFLGIFVPFVFIAERAMSLGVEKREAALLLSVIGITNTIGRVVAGVVADVKGVNPLLLHNVAILMAGLCCLLNTFCTTYPLMCVFAAVFGLCFAGWISLTTIVLVRLMGMERLTNAFGLLTMVRGVCSVAGAPLAGVVYDITKNYDMAFHVGGILLIITGLLFSLLHLPCMQPKTIDNGPQIVVVETEQGLLKSAEKIDTHATENNV